MSWVRLVIEIALLNRPLFRPGSPLAFAVALAITIGATLTRLALAPLFAPVPFGGMPFAVAFLGVLLTAFLCGTAGGVVAALLSVGAV
ncbi:MAG TPA: hypothetical protein VGF92_16665, partial [Stellaceae bacterium]